MVDCSESIEGLPEIPDGYVWIFVAVPEEHAADIRDAIKIGLGGLELMQPEPDGPEREIPDGNREAEEPDRPDR